MQFLTPTMLALAGIAAPILLLYMLRLRRREVPVSSTMLWQKLLQDREANAPWQKLRRNLLLLLQLLILAVLVVALARPFFPVPSVAAGSVALLLDASASMTATDMPGGGTRFDAAKDQARSLVGELATGDVMTIINVGPTPQVLTPPTEDRVALRDAINRAQPSTSPADWAGAMALASASVAGREDATIVIISDGGLPDDLPTVAAEVRYLKVGRSTDNLAVSALATRPLGDQPQLFAAVTNYGAQDADVILSLTVDGTLHSADRLTVPAGGTSNLTVTDLAADTQVIQADLTSPVSGGLTDYLAADDTAYAVYTPPAGGRVLLVSEGNLFFEQVLASLPGLEAFKVQPGDLPDEQYDLVIFDGWLPDTLPDTNLLIVNPPQSTDIFTVGDTFTDTRFLRQADDPILSFVDFSNIAIREAVMVETDGWARPLAEAEGGPILLAGSTGGRRIAILTFDLHNSDLPLRIEFPILFVNLLEWYAPAQPFEAADALRPGDPVVIRPRAASTSYRITYPDGSRQSFPIGEEEALTFSRTDEPGVYGVELLSGGEVTATGRFTVNLFSPQESDIAPRDSIQIGRTEVTGTAQGEDTYGQYELWPWLAGAALLVLIIEWWVYHRGSLISERERQAREEKPRRGLLYFGRRQ